jgi:NlpC/P60 family putative phage cell wall peptidase
MSIVRNDIVVAARQWIGTPYLHQASLLNVGCDCLGLVRGVWRETIGAEPERFAPYAPDWAEATRAERLADAGARHFAPADPRAIKAGDVLLFRWRAEAPAKHCAIATSATSMVHAHEGACVCEVAISPWWRRRLAYAFTFPNLSDF